jgi:hypothetical protein
LSVDVVLADGSFVTASADREEDLFWAVREGGGNFGVVTSFTFALHPVHTVVAGPTFWELDDAAEVMRAYREFLPQAPEELNGFFAFLTVPPAPPFPDHLHGHKVCGVIWCHAGAPEALEALLAPMRAIGSVVLDGLMPMPYPVIQSAFDALYPPGDQWYWRADHVKELPDEAIEKHVEFAHALPTPQSTMHLYPIDGAVHRVGPDEPAWRYRDATWAEVIVGVDPDPARAGDLRDWTVAYWEAVSSRYFEAGLPAASSLATVQRAA